MQFSNNIYRFNKDDSLFIQIQKFISNISHFQCLKSMKKMALVS